MDEKQALSIVKESLPQRRYEHTLRVTEEAEKLATRYHVNIKQARLAAILHDYAKYRPVNEMRDTVAKTKELPNALLDYGNEILHSFVGAHYIEMEHGIIDGEILSAIRYHTTGRDNMSSLEKVVFLADYIEPGRTIEAVKEVREIAKTDLDHACYLALKHTVTFLVSKNEPIYPDTFKAYNYYARLISRRS